MEATAWTGLAGLRREVVLQRAHGEVAVLVAQNAFDGGDGAGDGGVVGNLAHQRGAADVAAVADRFLPGGGVDDELHAAVLHGVDDVRPAFGDLVDLGRDDAVVVEVAVGAGGG